MRRSSCGMIIVVAMAMLLPSWSVYGQVSSKKPQSLPQVPIRYASDTDATVIRRAQWIEGAKKEGEIVWWSTKTAPICNKILAEFNKIYPFIKGSFWLAPSDEKAAKLEVETLRGNYTVDVYEGGDESYPKWRPRKIMGKITDIIPGIDKWSKGVYSPYADWAASGSHVVTPQYNTNLVSKAEALKNWEDLLDPKWKGQISITDDLKPWMVLALEGGWGVEKTERFLSKLKEQKLIWGKGHSSAHTLLKAGDFKILGEGYLVHLMDSQKQGAPVDIARVNPVIVFSSILGFIDKAPHPYSARLFLEWLLSPQGLQFYETISGQGLVYPGASSLQAKAVEGLTMTFRSEETIIRAMQLGLPEKFAKATGLER